MLCVLFCVVVCLVCVRIVLCACCVSVCVHVCVCVHSECVPAPASCVPRRCAVVAKRCIITLTWGARGPPTERIEIGIANAVTGEKTAACIPIGDVMRKVGVRGATEGVRIDTVVPARALTERLR